MENKIKKALTINQKWYITLCIAVVLNISWNYKNSSTTHDQGERITQLEKENLLLKQTNVELLSKAFLGQRVLDNIPFSIWKKKLVNGAFLMKYINNVGREQFLKDRGIDRYYYHNKTDFDVFSYSEAIKFHVEDSIVAYSMTDTVAHFDTDFYNATKKVFIQDGYTRWREITPDGDTLVWGKMDRFYKPK